MLYHINNKTKDLDPSSYEWELSLSECYKLK